MFRNEMDLFGNQSSLKWNRFETAIWASKLVLMSMGILSTLFLLKVAIIPFAFDLVLSTFPRLWVSVRTLLSPPFVYVIVNFIIITIAASSNFHHKTLPFSDSPTNDLKHTLTDHEFSDTTHQSEPENQSNEPREGEEEEGGGVKEEEDENTEVKDSGFSPVDPSPENTAGDNSSPDADDTLDGTWKAIMKLKKSDTWTAGIRKAEPLLPFGGVEDGNVNDDGGGDDDDNDPVAWAKRELRKSDTFNDRASLRREKSMSPEELNKRAEAFIKMINDQMKLQRLESHQRFMEMLNGSV